MFSETLLLHGWTLRADELPETDETVDNTGFTLPGALSLKAFSDLLGMDEDEPEETTDGSGMRVCFPGKLPEGVRGKACVSREIDFGRMTGTRAMLEIDHLCGTGAILLGEKELLSFSGGMDAADLLAARGYGLSPRSSYRPFVWQKRDKWLLTFLAFGAAALLLLLVQAGGWQAYAPNPPADIRDAAAFALLWALLFIPLLGGEVHE